MEDERYRDETVQQVDVFQLTRQIETPGAAVNSLQLIEQWNGRGDGMNYARVLGLLLRHDNTDLDALDAAVGLLDELRNPYNTGPIYLAQTVVELLARPDIATLLRSPADLLKGRTTAVQFLAREFPDWVPRLSAEITVPTLRLLEYYDEANREAHSHLLAREEARLLREALEGTLLPLRRQGRFFEIVWHYFRTLSWYGLETVPEVSPGELHQMPTAERRAVIAACRAWPLPYDSDDPDCPLSGTYLQVGYAVFHDDELAADVRYDDARATITETAEDAVPRLLAQATAMRYLSEEIKVVLRHHQSVFDLPLYAVA
jgi:hypothetical protein